MVEWLREPHAPFLRSLSLILSEENFEEALALSKTLTLPLTLAQIPVFVRLE
jgi:hypothetical protein